MGYILLAVVGVAVLLGAFYLIYRGQEKEYKKSMKEITYHKVKLRDMKGDGVSDYVIGLHRNRSVISDRNNGDLGFIGYEVINGTEIPGFIALHRIVSWDRNVYTGE